MSWVIESPKRLIASLVVGLVLLVAVVVTAGLTPIGASSGHWPITAWFLHFAMQRSVSTWSLGVDAPKLDDERRVLRGAGHYETGCRPCHGSPLAERPRIVLEMTPQPPIIPLRLDSWRDRELFYIVRHGIKFTAMPAWPSEHRDDEVWDMVAFLRRLPELDATSYRELVGLSEPEQTPSSSALASTGDVDAVEPEFSVETSAPIDQPSRRDPLLSRELLRSCERCHGAGGVGRGDGAFPRIAAQRREYLDGSLAAFGDAQRHSGIMGPIAAALTPEVRAALARQYAGLPPTRSAATQERTADDEATISRGRQIVETGIPQRRVPACASCHLSHSGEGARAEIPVLNGLAAAYLEQQLSLWRSGHRGGTVWSRLMEPFAERIDESSARNVAAYYASLPPHRDAEETPDG